jgi:hypothetical protein
LHRARQVTRYDFQRFSHLVALDLQNLATLEAMRPTHSDAELSLLLDYVEGRKGEAVADPYYGEAAGFEVTWADVTIGAEALERRIAEKRRTSLPKSALRSSAAPSTMPRRFTAATYPRSCGSSFLTDAR